MLRIIFLTIAMLLSSASLCRAAEPAAQSESERAMARGATRSDDPTRALQIRLRLQVAKGVTLDSYAVGLAQAWLDYVRETYFRKDRRASREALAEAQAVIEAMEKDGAEARVNARIIASSSRLRDDLWRQAAAFKQHPQWPCGAWPTARLEVALVAAGRANNDFGWRAARQFVQRAERHMRDADEKLKACAEPKPVATETPAKSAPEASGEITDAPLDTPTKPQTSAVADAAPALSLPDRVHFARDSAELSDVSALVLEQVSYIMRANAAVTLDLRGHADELPTAADSEKLATARAQAVRDYLLETGIGRERMNVQPGKAEAGEGKSGAERAKLRRVELIPTQSDPVPIEYQDKDLSTEGPQG